MDRQQEKYISFGLLVEPPSSPYGGLPSSSKENVSKYSNSYHCKIEPSRQSEKQRLTCNTKPQSNLIENTFSDMVVYRSVDRSTPLVVLDAANIGWCYGIDSFDATGVCIALDYFRRLSVEVRAFIPAVYLRSKPTDGTRGNAVMITDEMEMLHSLAGSEILTVVPTGDSDDAYILNYARDYNGFVVSNDLFQDHISNMQVKSVQNSMAVWLQEHRCGYAFLQQREFFFNPASSLRTAIDSFKEKQQLLKFAKQFPLSYQKLNDTDLSSQQRPLLVLSSGTIENSSSYGIHTIVNDNSGSCITQPNNFSSANIIKNAANTYSSVIHCITTAINDIVKQQQQQCQCHLNRCSNNNSNSFFLSAATAPIVTTFSSPCSKFCLKYELKCLLLTRASLLLKVRLIL